MSVTKATFCHSELREWDKALQFFTEETRVFEKRLEEVVNKNSVKEVLAEAEHYQNQFILQKEQFDLLRHDIHEQEGKIEQDVVAHIPIVLDAPLRNTQIVLNGRMQSAEKIFKDTRRTFYQFLSQVL